MTKYIKALDIEVVIWISLLILGLFLFGSMGFTLMKEANQNYELKSIKTQIRIEEEKIKLQKLVGKVKE